MNRVLKVIFLILFIVACAHKEFHQLKKEEIVPYQEYSQITYAKEKTEDIGSITVTDKRPRPSSLGVAYLGINYKETPIVPYEDTKEFLKDFFYTALSERNINFTEGSPRNLEIIIKSLTLNEKIEQFKPELAECVVEMDFHFTSPDKKTTISTRAKVTSPGDYKDGTDRLAPTLASCLNSIAESLVKSEDLYKFL